MSANTAPKPLYADRGPVLAAARVLIDASTLNGYVDIVDPGAGVAEIHWTGGQYSYPLETVGSGTKALWHLLESICHSRHEVSLYDTISRLDPRNRTAVASAINALVGVQVVSA